MTARAERRRRGTWVGFIGGSVLALVAMALVVVAVVTLANSTEGKAAEVDERPVVVFPVTPNAALAVTDDDGALVSLIVATLLPDGEGGSIVTIPVSADVSAGLVDQRTALSAVFAENPAGFFDSLSGMLGITIERSAVVTADELVPLIEAVAPIEVDVPIDVVDSSTIGSGIIVTAGEQNLRAQYVADALAAVDSDVVPYTQHQIDVALWSALAANAPVPGSSVPTDDAGNPIAPATVDDLFARLWQGEVSVRDLDLQVDLTGADPTQQPVVVVSRGDVYLVFTQVSPSLVIPLNSGLVFRLEVGFSDEQLAASDGLFESNSQAARRLIEEILFFQGNVTSTSTEPIDGGAPAVTRVMVADERYLADAEEFAPLLFGESEVVLADTVLDGVDVVVQVGTGYIDYRNETD